MIEEKKVVDLTFKAEEVAKLVYDMAMANALGNSKDVVAVYEGKDITSYGAGGAHVTIPVKHLTKETGDVVTIIIHNKKLNNKTQKDSNEVVPQKNPSASLHGTKQV